MQTVDKTAVKKSVFDLIMQGNLDQAEMLRNDNSITSMEINNLAEKAFSDLVKTDKFALAIEISERYRLPIEGRIEAASAQFRSFVKDKEYTRAIAWGMKYGLPETEIKNVTIKAFNDALEEKDIAKALDLKHEYNISIKSITESMRMWFNVFFEQGEYLKALLLGQEFEISRKRMLTTGIRAFIDVLSKGNIPKFTELEKKYTILIDSDLALVDTKDMGNFTRVFITVVVKGLIDKNQAGQLVKINETLQLFENRDINPYTGTLVNQIAVEVAADHNRLMESGNFAEAYELLESFHLLSEVLSEEEKVELIETAEKAHHKLLRENNLKRARKIRDDYKLFGKNIIAHSIATLSTVSAEFIKKALINNNIEDAKTAIEEYGPSKDTVNLIIDDVLLELLRDRKHIEAFDIVKKLKVKVSTPDILTEAAKSFDESYRNGQMELASNLAYFFKLKDTRAVKAAYFLWNREMDAGRYDAALELKKRYKIPRNKIEPVVKNIYNTLTASNRLEEAVMVRHKYNMNLSFLEWMGEFFNKLFKQQ